MAIANEFSRPIAIESWPEGGVPFEVTATPEERAALAVRLGLTALDTLAARGHLEAVEPGRLIRLRGTLEASVVQDCVVSLEPVASKLVETVQRCFRPVPRTAVEAMTAAGEEVVVDPEEQEEIEPLAGASIDVGEVMAEELALALDPYPRAPDAVARVERELGPDVSLNAPEGGNRPFTALRRFTAG